MNFERAVQRCIKILTFSTRTICASIGISISCFHRKRLLISSYRCGIITLRMGSRSRREWPTGWSQRLKKGRILIVLRAIQLTVISHGWNWRTSWRVGSVGCISITMVIHQRRPIIPIDSLKTQQVNNVDK